MLDLEKLSETLGAEITPPSGLNATRLTFKTGRRTALDLTFTYTQANAYFTTVVLDADDEIVRERPLGCLNRDGITEHGVVALFTAYVTDLTAGDIIP